MADWDTAHSFQSVCDCLRDKHDKPGAIKRACNLVEECLISNKDNLRGFFEHCFPLLLKRIFGYDDKEASWLQIVSVDARDEDATALIQLLAPTGPLFAALHAADGDQLIQFLFPPERLQPHTQDLLRLPAGRLELDSWPQYHGRLRLDGAGRCQVHLNMFQYFMFWAAFYVLRAGPGDKSGKGSSGSSRGRTFIPPGARNLWRSSGFSSSERITSAKHPYFQLLRLYLEQYLPRPASVSPLGSGAGSAAAKAGLGGRGSGGGSSRPTLAGLGASSNAAFAGQLLSSTPGETLLSVLLEFWLTDAGEPLPAEPQPPAASRAGSPTGQLLPAAAAVGAGGIPIAGAAGAAAAAAGSVGSWGAASALGSLSGASAAGSLAGGAAVLGLGPVGGLGVPATGGLGVLGDPLSQHALMMGGAGASGAAGAVGLGSLAGGSVGLTGADGLLNLSLSSGGGLAVGAGVLPAGAGAGPLHTYSYQPPADELVQALMLLVRYVFVGEPSAPDALPVPAQGSSKWLPLSPVATLPLPAGRLALPHQAAPGMASAAFSPPVQAVSRKLYRLLRRTFAQWQPSSSSSLDNLVKLWLVVLTPWKRATYNDTKDLLATIDTLTAAAVQRGARSTGKSGSTIGGTAGSLGSTAGAVLRGAAGSAAGLVGSSSIGRGSSSGGDGGQHGLFGGAGQVAASAAANLNRWGSEMAHRMGTHQGELDQAGDRRDRGAERGQQYSPAWRSHVLAHLPFYTVLLPAFLELCYSQMAYCPKIAYKAAYRVIRDLAESGPELIAELRQAETAYNRYIGSSIRRPEGELAELLPWLADQAADWEAAAAAGAPTTPPLTPDARYLMFSLEQGGAPSCMRALLAAADRQNLQGREKFRQCADAVLPLSELPSEEAAATIQTAAGRDLPKAGNWRNLHYHGDWMLRPIASNEIAWLVRLLVAISRAVNSALQLNGIPTPAGEEPPETVLQEVLSVARRRGWRLNLRPLAEVQTLAWLFGLLLIAHWMWALITSEGGLFGLDEEYYQELATGRQQGQFGAAGQYRQPELHQHQHLQHQQ